MNLPWNPAKLEQRLGRIHRRGQRRGVTVIKLVAQGSIKQGMLGVLAFKQSLSSGVLGGGDSTVFMNGTRLSKFGKCGRSDRGHGRGGGGGGNSCGSAVDHASERG